jgi:ribonuclease Z
MVNSFNIVSGTLVELLDACILLDCGEGTLGQLSRRYGDRLDSVLKTLKLIFISHMHADHHLGLFAVLKAAKAVGAAVFIVGPSYLSNWINEYSCLEDLGEYTFYDCEEFVGSQKFKPTPNLPDAISKISTTPVVHCEKSYAVVIVTTDGFKLGFSGDCRPDEKFAQLGNGCDLLIHEATFDDSMHEEALKKLHSTVTEAIDIGLAMKAKCLLLTHFSSRYKFPEMKDIAKSPLGGLIVGIAQDLMYIQMDQFWKLPLYSDSMKNVNMASESADVEKAPAKKLKNSQCNFES